MLRLRREITDLRGELRTTELSLERIELAIEESRKRIEEKSDTFRSMAMTELSQKKAELRAVEQAFTAADDKVRRTEVVSPVRGGGQGDQDPHHRRRHQAGAGHHGSGTPR